MQGHRLGTEHFTNLLYDIQEVSACTVHFVDEAQTGNAITVGLTPYRLGLGLNAVNRREEGDQTIQYAHGTLHLHGEVHVTRSIDDIELVLLGVWR